MTQKLLAYVLTKKKTPEYYNPNIRDNISESMKNRIKGTETRYTTTSELDQLDDNLQFWIEETMKYYSTKQTETIQKEI